MIYIEEQEVINLAICAGVIVVMAVAAHFLNKLIDKHKKSKEETE